MNKFGSLMGIMAGIFVKAWLFWFALLSVLWLFGISVGGLDCAVRT